MRDAQSQKGKKISKHGADSAAKSIDDPRTSKLLKMGKAVGNTEIQQRLAQGNSSRDELLLFLTQRLGTLREVQVREMAETGNQRDWWKDVSDSHKEGTTKPDPTRWSEAASIYEEAAYQLSRGSLGRGAQLVNRALEAERRAFDSLSSVVDLKDVENEVDGPDCLGDVLPNQGSSACEVPAEAQRLADEITRVTETFVTPPNKARTKDPWWTEEEEEEEEGGNGGVG